MMLYDSTALRPSSATFGSDLSTSFLVAFLVFLVVKSSRLSYHGEDCKSRKRGEKEWNVDITTTPRDFPWSP